MREPNGRLDPFHEIQREEEQLVSRAHHKERPLRRIRVSRGKVDMLKTSPSHCNSTTRFC